MIQNIEKDIKAINAPVKPKKQDIDKLLYVSTYQRGYHQPTQQCNSIIIYFFLQQKLYNKLE